MSTSSETASTQEAQWDRVREAITKRWPHINHDELAKCTNDTCQLTDFVKQHVEASNEEVESVVAEFAPQESIVDRVSHAASRTLGQANESAQLAYLRADECIAERPTQSVLTSFLAGILVGATVTAMLMRSKPEPSTWDRIKSQSWT